MKEIIYGKNSVSSLLENNSDRINKILIAKGIKYDGMMKKIISSAKKQNIIVQEVPREKINKLADGVNQGIMASVSPVEYVEYSDFEKTLTGSNDVVLVLDSVEDPHNFGSIVRTAAAAGVKGIIIPKRNSSPITGTVHKASAGAIEKVPIIRVANIVNVLEKLKKKSFWVIGAESTGDKYHFEQDYDMNCVIVMGGESKGVGQIIKKNCDFMVKIPMPGCINSLNVANATSIIIYEVLRQHMLKE